MAKAINPSTLPAKVKSGMRKARPAAISTKAIKSKTITKVSLPMASVPMPVALAALATASVSSTAAHGLALALDGKPPDTCRAYASDWRHFEAWARMHNVNPTSAFAMSTLVDIEGPRHFRFVDGGSSVSAMA